MTTISNANQRISSIDLVKGLAMLIMALDHVRDYVHAPAFLFDPADPTQTTLAIFFTRWVTHFCAPAFSFLAGMSAFMVGKRKSLNELSGFLLKRGIWLIFIELTIVGFAWYFDLSFGTFGLLTIWSLGISMVVLAGLVYLPKKFILIFSIVLIFGHNLLDNIQLDDSILWAVLHRLNIFMLSENLMFVVGYPMIPWIGVMALGYWFGTYYNKSVDSSKRKLTFNMVGICAIILFVVLRWTNVYGDPVLFQQYDRLSQDLVSFLNPSKYPPSLLYLLMTLGGTFILLANSEKWKGKAVDFICTFGRVPFFYYIIHIYLIHLIAIGLASLSGFEWKKNMILAAWGAIENPLPGYGFPLWVVYAVWISVILLLFPVCKKFDQYKQGNKDKWWLSYL
ncbi:DUF1624 domain-containing protein [Aquiflexum gelatinilyticum]|uniref:Heparan-alpha-glucosaminide N-acetyltransferase domain-containing protein n=1 Tax=Aquiflexum gelatinilyticum TaxID=2961943 RepID=A0A9X2T1S9_9BACT|nr:heparan-alpha-glucosaminide N-acetyltransferase domain-containing protein [Aquiflexum gelatinilyticum]MCR9017088.1 heparan-alpha-glucosaminide N-acetyltransferase domain-containing protein [Aquiflexum gelatinilyticum]